jgi:cellulose synthase/poly-beta-1,6-N-acetylglucosamine synthase-like glycosyltransferase
MRPARTLFWASSALIVYTHAGYPALLWLLARGRHAAPPAEPVSDPAPAPPVSVVVAAYDEEDVIARKVENVLAADYPRDRLELIVASDGSADRTAERAREAGADLVLDLPRGGKVRAQDRAVERASGEIVVFSDANATLAPDALRRLVGRFAADPRLGYVCGQVRFAIGDGSNQEGVYWRYEMAVRELESRIGDVTAGNGALYATRRESYVEVDPRMGHDLSFPFNMVKRGWRAKYEPGATASEKATPTNESEFRRKRRMMSHTWPIMLAGGILDPRGYSPLYALQIVSHRLLRYLTPFLHAIAIATAARLATRGALYRLALGAHAGLLAAAALGGGRGAPRSFRLARYYVLVTASPAAGLWDWLRTGTPAGWEKAEGTR